VLNELKTSAILGSGESGMGEEVSGTLGGTLRAAATKDSELQRHRLRCNILNVSSLTTKGK